MSEHAVGYTHPGGGTIASPAGTTAEQARRRRAARSPGYRAEAARIAPYEDIARLVIDRRIKLAMTQAQLAALMDTSVSAVSRLESGQHRPNVETLRRLALAFGERLIVGFETAAGERDLVVVRG